MTALVHKETEVIFLDFCKAFDRVKCHIFISELERYSNLVSKELFGRLQPGGRVKWLCVQVETGDKWCLQRVLLRTSALQHLYL